MFYRPGGSSQRINAQYDMVYSDVIGGATGWLPVSVNNSIAVNICRASIQFQNAASSKVTKSPVAYEAVVLLEYKQFGGDNNVEAWPIDQWQNTVVATDRRAHRDGWVRLRITNLNNADGTGLALSLQISRKGSTGVVT